MTGHAGERLFEAIGQIPDGMVLEAAQEQADVDGADVQAGQGKELRTGQGEDLQEGYAKDGVRAGQVEILQEGHAQEELQTAYTTDGVRAVQEEGLQERYAKDGTREGLQEEYAEDGVRAGQGEGLQEGHVQGAWRQAGRVKKRLDRKTVAAGLGRYLKYLPVAACLCIVFGSAFYVVHSFIGGDYPKGVNGSGGQDVGQMDGTDSSFAMDGKMEDAVTEESAEGELDAGAGEGSAGGWQDQAPEKGAGTQGQDGFAAGAGSGRTPLLPARDDAYEGPVFALTATGDTQKLKASRRLKGVVSAEGEDGSMQPLLQVTDTYKIRNTSQEDKTLQLVYPFVATLNRAYDMEDEVLQVEGEYQTPVSYSIGEGILPYRNANLPEAASEKAGLPQSASLEDYVQIFGGKTEYQEQALKKEAVWKEEVNVYTFSNISVQEDAGHWNGQGVIGVTVRGAKAKALTYGFDHSFEREDGSSCYCFFVPQEPEKLLLVVAGEQEGEPQLGYYANLDCEEEIGGIQCEMRGQEMPYADALRLCCNDAVRTLRQEYQQGVYDAKLPEYMDEDAAFCALTMVGEEETFYDDLAKRYQSTELKEILERLFGETRVVYAMATVTVPAKQSVRVTAHTQKRQNSGKFILMQESGDAKVQEGRYQYDFFSSKQSRLQVTGTDFRLVLGKEWQLAGDTMGLKRRRQLVWGAKLGGKPYSFSVSRSGE